MEKTSQYYKTHWQRHLL